MLHEVQLLIGRGGPEVVTKDDEAAPLGFTFGVHELDRRFPPERGVGEDHIETVAGIGLERVLDADR